MSNEGCNYSTCLLNKCKFLYFYPKSNPMKKLFSLKNIFIVVVAIIVIIQFFRIDKTQPAVNPETDYISMVQPSDEIKGLIKNACYDCHSNETVYPWYTNIAPVSWMIKSHINEGREQLNFSEWGNYQPGKRGHKQDECKEMLVEGEMPLKGYTIMHSSANMTDEQKAVLIKWFTNE